MKFEFKSDAERQDELMNELFGAGFVFDEYRFDCLRQVLGSVFIYDDEKQLPEKYSKTEYLKYEHDKQSLEKIDLAVYNLLRRVVDYVNSISGFDFIGRFDKIDKDKFLQSERLKIFIDALDTCPNELFVYMDFENGDIVFKMEYVGHTPKPLMKIEFDYPNFELKLLV